MDCTFGITEYADGDSKVLTSSAFVRQALWVYTSDYGFAITTRSSLKRISDFSGEQEAIGGAIQCIHL
jgi:hypothetical protein